ncbi:MAG TPA: hypothetical protein VGB20_03245 [bacterium]
MRRFPGLLLIVAAGSAGVFMTVSRSPGDAPNDGHRLTQEYDTLVTKGEVVHGTLTSIEAGPVWIGQDGSEAAGLRVLVVEIEYQDRDDLPRLVSERWLVPAGESETHRVGDRIAVHYLDDNEHVKAASERHLAVRAALERLGRD